MQQQQLHLRASPPLKCHFPLPAHMLSFFFFPTHCLASSFLFLWNNVSFHLYLSPIPPHLDLGLPRCTYPHIDTQIQCKTYQNPRKNFCRYTEKIILHFVQKSKRIGIAKTMWKKKNVEEIILPKFKTYIATKTLCDLMDCNLLGSSVHGISQARILEWEIHFLLQGIFLTQGQNPGLLLGRQILFTSETPR